MPRFVNSTQQLSKQYVSKEEHQIVVDRMNDRLNALEETNATLRNDVNNNKEGVNNNKEGQERANQIMMLLAQQMGITVVASPASPASPAAPAASAPPKKNPNQNYPKYMYDPNKNFESNELMYIRIACDFAKDEELDCWQQRNFYRTVRTKINKKAKEMNVVPLIKGLRITSRNGLWVKISYKKKDEKKKKKSSRELFLAIEELMLPAAAAPAPRQSGNTKKRKKLYSRKEQDECDFTPLKKNVGASYSCAVQSCDFPAFELCDDCNMYLCSNHHMHGCKVLKRQKEQAADGEDTEEENFGGTSSSSSSLRRQSSDDGNYSCEREGCTRPAHTTCKECERQCCVYHHHSGCYYHMDLPILTV